MGIISVLASLSVWGLSSQVNKARHSEARSVLAQIATKQEAQIAMRGRYMAVTANPPGALPVNSERHDWDFDDKNWKALGVKPSRGRLFHQYTVYAGKGQTCTAKPGCAGITGQAWWWAKAEREGVTLYINSKRSTPWIVEN